MTYSIAFRKQVLRSLKDNMTIREAANFYQLSISSIHSSQLTAHSSQLTAELSS